MFQLASFDGENLDVQALASSYIDHGFVLVKDLISESERSAIGAELIKINRGEYPCPSVVPPEDEKPDDVMLTRYMYLGEPHVLSPVIKHFISHPELVRVLDVLVGAHIPYWDGAYKCVQTMAVSKKPGGNGSPWHQDEHPIPTRDRSLTGIWIPLKDTTVDNGCLWVIPSSHRAGVIYERYKHNLPDVDSMTIARGFDASTEAPIEMRAGSVLFFNGYLLHSSKRNVTPRNRPALTMHYCSAGTILTWKEQRNYRGITPVKGTDPYAEEGYTTPETWAVL